MHLFHLLVLLKLGHTAVANQNHVTLTLNGAKDVPIRGFLLSENKACDGAKMDDTRIMNKLTSIEKRIEQLDTLGGKIDGLKNNMGTSTQRLTALENNIKEVKKGVTDIKFSTVPGTGYIGCYTDCGSRMLAAKYIQNMRDLSLGKCKSICKGYKYLGLQYAQELEKRKECVAEGVGIPCTSYEEDEILDAKTKLQN
ncbi:unnamed protein product [Mytilus coruscus]|uniref:Uncharacterized protein n=1 Tax=Mytilus coruscus TaxID=42192 RepID=A0A6J7ZZF2_MYTCO|nr:unnamed protein product [Mytilus coruscus]